MVVDIVILETECEYAGEKKMTGKRVGGEEVETAAIAWNSHTKIGFLYVYYIHSLNAPFNCHSQSVSQSVAGKLRPLLLLQLDDKNMLQDKGELLIKVVLVFYQLIIMILWITVDIVGNVAKSIGQ